MLSICLLFCFVLFCSGCYVVLCVKKKKKLLITKKKKYLNVSEHTMAARYWKKLTLRYFDFLQYILRYEEEKKNHQMI